MNPDGAPHVSVVVPAFNEEENVRPVLEDMITAFAASPDIGDFEIILVNDGSRDRTAERAEDLASRFACVRVLHHEVNRGIGAALKTGYAAARGDLVTSIGADGEVAVEELLNLVRMAKDADLVVSRRVRPPGSRLREFYSAAFHKFTALLVGFDLRGMEGLYVVRGDLLRDLSLHSNSPLVNVEIIMQCFARKCRVATGEIHVLPRLSGESKMATWRSISKVVLETFMLRVSLYWGRLRGTPRRTAQNP